MNWLIQLFQFGYGFFLRGLTHASGGNSIRDWEQHINALAHNTEGVDISFIQSRIAFLEVNHKDDIYALALHLQGNTVVMVIFSHVLFPSGRTPRDVAEFLQRKNYGIKPYKFFYCDQKEGAFCLVMAQMSAGHLTLANFQLGMRDMINHVVSLDTVLVNEGYSSPMDDGDLNIEEYYA